MGLGFNAISEFGAPAIAFILRVHAKKKLNRAKCYFQPLCKEVPHAFQFTRPL